MSEKHNANVYFIFIHRVFVTVIYTVVNTTGKGDSFMNWHVFEYNIGSGYVKKKTYNGHFNY